MLGQAKIRAGGAGRGNLAGIIIRLIAVRKIDQALAVESPLFAWNDRWIGYQIVDKCRRHRAGIAEIADLDRRKTILEEARPRMLRITLEVNGDIKAVGTRQIGKGTIRW